MRDCLPGSHAFERGAVACKCGAVSTAKGAAVPRCEACGQTHWRGRPIALAKLKGRLCCANCRQVARADAAEGK